MSNTVRIALVAEGVTDYEVLKAAVESMLHGRSLDIKLLQPEGSVAFTGGGDAGPHGGGWRGVYKFCLAAMERGSGKVLGDPVFRAYDIVVLHLDADVAAEDPANYPVHPIAELGGVLPCEQPCPPPNNTTDRLRKMLLAWIGETQTPPQTVLCTPSKSTEAWVVAIFFPHDREMIRKGWECHSNPASRLAVQPKRKKFAKTRDEYRARNKEIQAGWPRIVKNLSEAKRFQDEFSAVLKTLPS